MASSTLRRASGGAGLTRNPSNPAARAPAPSPRRAEEVRSSSRTAPIVASARIRRASSTPSISGMWKSMMPMSKASPAAAASRRRASASCPSPAVDARMPQFSACRCSPVRLMAESSTIRTRSPLRSLADGSAAGIGASGSRSSNQNVEPGARRALHPDPPPINSTRRLEIARPRPVPPYFRVVEASAWLNSVNSRVRLCLADADPGIGHRDAQRPRRSPAAARSSRSGHAPAR